MAEILKKNEKEKSVQETEAECSLPAIFGDVKSREEVMREIESDAAVYSMYLNLNQEFREEFVQFCMGVRGVKMTYDPFFKYIFDAEVHPERLSDMLSLVIGRPLKVKRVLPNEHRRITEKGSLIIMDILVEFETGELADVEIQKIGYLFPGQRASCYASDMVMRQYERHKAEKGEDFTYRNLTKVYTIVFLEESSGEFRKNRGHYVHRGKWVFDSGIDLELLQEFFFISLDIFRSIEDNKKKETWIGELEAWLYFIGSDRPKDIRRVIESHPKFAEMYREIVRFRYHPKEAIGMFSEALRIMDENTVKYMIDEMRREYAEALEDAKKQMKEQMRAEIKKEMEERADEAIRNAEMRERAALQRVEELEKLLAEKSQVSCEC